MSKARVTNKEVSMFTKGHKSTHKATRKAITHTVRTPTGTKTIQKLTKSMAIKLHCTECMGFQTAEVARCTSPMCALYPFRRATRAALKG